MTQFSGLIFVIRHLSCVRGLSVLRSIMAGKWHGVLESTISIKPSILNIDTERQCLDTEYSWTVHYPNNRHLRLILDRIDCFYPEQCLFVQEELSISSS